MGRALGVSRSRINQLERGNAKRANASDALGVDGLLQLLILTKHLDPPAILRAAGKRNASVARALESIYGKIGRERLTKWERDFHAKLKELTPRDFAAVYEFIEVLASARRRAKPPSRGRKNSQST